MSKYNNEIKNQICGLIEEDAYTIPEICKSVGIAERTFHKWKKEISEFSRAIEMAIKNRNEKFAQIARNSLLKKIRGFEVTDIKVIHTWDKNTGELIKKEIIKTTKHIPPNISALMFVLTSIDSENWITQQDKTTKIPVQPNAVIMLPDNKREHTK